MVHCRLASLNSLAITALLLGYAVAAPVQLAEAGTHVTITPRLGHHHPGQPQTSGEALIENNKLEEARAPDIYSRHFFSKVHSKGASVANTDASTVNGEATVVWGDVADKTHPQGPHPDAELHRDAMAHVGYHQGVQSFHDMRVIQHDAKGIIGKPNTDKSFKFAVKSAERAHRSIATAKAHLQKLTKGKR